MENLDALIGSNLARLRGEISQQDIAEKMREYGFKWSQATVWAVEKGERPLRLTEAEILRRILDRKHIFGVIEFLSSTGEMRIADALEHTRKAKTAFEASMSDYFEALDQLALTADQISTADEAKEIPPFRWHAVRGWLTDDSPMQASLAATRKHELLENTAGVGDEMVDRGVRTFRELVEARDADARKEGFEDYETKWAKSYRAVGNYSGLIEQVSQVDTPDDSDEIDYKK